MQQVLDSLRNLQIDRTLQNAGTARRTAVLPAVPGVYDHGYAVFARKHGRCMPQLRRRIHTYEERC